jgi:CRP-like cAMP-binding protein
MEQLLHYFKAQGFSTDDATKIIEQFRPAQVKKGDLWVQEGKTSKHLGFIQTGYLQYYIVVEGVEKTTYALGAGNFIASLVSFLKQTPSRENIRAVMDSELWLIDRQSLATLQKQIPAFQQFYVGLLEWQICCIDESRLDAIILNAQQRYEKMMEKEPEIIRHIPMQYLASILGVTPRHLSRIRNNIR